MWTPWRRRRQSDDADRKLAEAERRLDETCARDAEVDAVAGALNRLRSRNRFAELIEEALRRQP